jgi:hypothetical protein
MAYFRPVCIHAGLNWGRQAAAPHNCGENDWEHDKGLNIGRVLRSSGR